MDYTQLIDLLNIKSDKNFKTLLIIIFILSLLGLNRRAPRSRRGRRYRGRRRPIQSGGGNNWADLLLPLATNVLGAVANSRNNNVREDPADEQDEVHSEDDPERDEMNNTDELVENQDMNNNSDVEEREEDPSEIRNSEVRNSENRNSERTRTLMHRTHRNSRVEAQEDRDPEAHRRRHVRGITEIIKEIYQGVQITVTLLNNQVITGEVIGDYNNILILRNNGILTYIKGEAIASFT